MKGDMQEQLSSLMGMPGISLKFLAGSEIGMAESGRVFDAGRAGSTATGVQRVCGLVKRRTPGGQDITCELSF